MSKDFEAGCDMNLGTRVSTGKVHLYFGEDKVMMAWICVQVVHKIAEEQVNALIF